MRVGDAQDFENALDRPVFADPAVQRVERDVGLQPCEDFGDVARDVDAGDAVAGLLERGGAAVSGIERDRPFRRPAAHQNRNMLHEPPDARALPHTGIKRQLTRAR